MLRQTFSRITGIHIPGAQKKIILCHGKAKKYSDLNLVIIAEAAIPTQQLNELRLAFSDSDLPIMVDLVDWFTLSEEFRDVISSDFESFLN